MGTEAHGPQAGAKRTTRAGGQAPTPLREGIPRVALKTRADARAHLFLFTFIL